jgi:nucleoside-diphosphate-sugar epimerase
MKLAPNITDVSHLEDLLSEPTEGVIAAFSRLDGNLLILGANGKMGPTLARMARRASDVSGTRRGIVAVSRFSSAGGEAPLRAHGIETIRCDLLDPDQLDALPDAPNVVYMPGMKFGATGNEARTWALNSFLPGVVSRKFRRSRIVAFSTGNVYPLTPVNSGGSKESDAPQPVGEYGMSCLGRERVFEHFSRALHIPMAILRLNYAVELRYGLLVDIALRVQAGQAIDLTMGHCNVIWQGDANSMALQAFSRVASPPFVVNIAGPGTLSVRRAAEEFGRLLGKVPVFEESEAGDALLSNGQLGHRLFGSPRVSVEQMIHWIAEWVGRGGVTLGKPTHFETRDGKF